ncbi:MULTISPECIES: thiol reductant ABC exporter subunit CydD [Streptomyces]|uniref:thiol reductant ABC exporter subunit CydD n=1 Tax=Streptomyces TaxID=1883 RepID=UPI0003A281A1|nr:MULTISPECIES: thiol reductant ABC exporter subunit CydD [Streptomyces]MBZ6110632.1 thiol reductant ABC exporter subunit CydD [Streptomyces olivaceus]MBZ6123349.1 thiol reductant ABC exporter subunit CydD [Streptomyces olivaceus]MBZ6146577.1 thiol reductant ABC exporter subunit CydD [Streptomyces olivaceus]MBZ6158627.1 thiol reductant ABC exporter subunit CydD [Streptomyces olivaceus]MBZ6188583.1 thiol reductant ABC exporter subunit CydD [Streptomyces olivaceus]
MKPIDPRLLRYARATRLFLAAVVALGAAGAGLLVAQAMLVAEVVVGAFQQDMTAAGLRTPLLLLVAVACGRALVGWLTELAAHRASAAVKSELRGRLLERVTALGPGGRAGLPTGSLVALATRGVDALDDYFSRYLPQLGLAVVVPVAVLARVVTEDWVSAAIIVGTLPLIPVFMVLIGWATQSRMDRQWRLLSRLSGHFLDVVAGLPTLKVFGRAKAQAESIKRITGAYRQATMRTLRIAFLSSFALELLATLSVALVAVTIGMRLVHGDMALYDGLVVLILAPEAYLPLRQVGAQYHAAAEGLAAAEEIFSVLERPVPASGTRPVPADGSLSFEGVTVRYPGRTADAVTGASFTVEPGETVALVGPSGAGKSTLLGALLGFVAPSGGRVRVGGADLSSLDLAQWHARVAWVPQHPHLYAGTIDENVRLARSDADGPAVRRALRDAGALEFVDALPEGAATVLGEDGAGLSAGQRQRLALARAFLADRPVLLLDEPTAALDGATEAEVVAAVRRLAKGRTVLLVVHRPALLEVADRVVWLPEQAAATPSGGAGQAPAVSAPVPLADADPSAGPADSTGAVRARGGVLTRVRAMSAVRRGRLGLGLLLSSLALGSAVGLMATSGYLISRASEQPPVLYLMVAVTATRAFGIGRAVFRYAERLVSHDAVLRMLADTRVAVYRRLERVAPAGLHRSRRGDLLSRLVADVDALQDYWLRWLLPAGAAVLVSAASVGFTAWLLPEAGAVLAAGLLAAGAGVPLVTGAVARRAERRLAPARGVLATRVTDLLTGTAELTVAGALPERTAGARRADGVLTRIAARAAAATALGDGLTALVSGLTVAGASLVGVQAVADGRLAGVALAVVVLTPLAAFEAVLGLPLAVQYRQRVRRSAERVYEVLDASAEVREPETPRQAPASPFPVVLRGLAARHPGQARDALAGVDLTLTRGRRVAVVGPSGSGKTTLAQVLLRFLDPDGGSCTLAGVDARALAGDDVRRLVGLCAQDAHLFDSSVRENLLLARKDATEGEVRDVLARARLLEWADSLPDGLDTLVGEHGARLSGGQRQRLALARALLADFPVLVLDEPAEHLDLPTADALTADLLAATEGRTTLLITHRLAGLRAVDEVVVLDRGRVVQRGPYAELAAVPGPLRDMAEREAAAETPAGVG